ncbi:MAG TPA: uroporphyrinogen decarboxylase [Oligoflexia bacterium]|nr:uroporphyrinogen decarboxylase [Oligoflexia bacterium]
MQESSLLKAYKGSRPAITPIWFMRQAGRYLPEYRAIRQRYSMLEAIQTPELASEITLQPIRRFRFDAAIIFADILTPLIQMGIDLSFDDGKGPIIHNLIDSPERIDALRVPEAGENCRYTLEAISATVAGLKGAPLIGFAGAPFTLSSYLFGSQGDLAANKLKKFFFGDPKSWERLQTKLALMVGNYLADQAASGAAALQLFDSWIGALSEEQFSEYVEPYLKIILKTVRERFPAVPLVYFSTCSSQLLKKVAELGFDALSVDWRENIGVVSERLGSNLPLQGNLDPALLFASPDRLRAAVSEIMVSAKVCKAHVFNLGHGILPQTPIENVELVVELVRSWR